MTPRESTNKNQVIKAGRWPQSQYSVVLIIIAFVASCGYLVHSILQIADTLR
jgi:hypothetical protein